MRFSPTSWSVPRRGVVALVTSAALLATLPGLGGSADARTTSAAPAPSLRSAATGLDTYTPPEGTRFVHWNEPSTRTYVKNHVLRSINSSPRGSRIRMMVYSFGDKSFTDAIINAVRRGVTVQVLVNSHNYDTWPEYRRLRNAIGVSIRRGARPPSRTSWARHCVAACRGRGAGHVHSKFILFQQAGSAKNVTMYGSWNPTTVANERQWNHWNTTYGAATYSAYLDVFQQAQQDRYFPYRQFTTDGLTSWIFPRPGTTATTDPMSAVFDDIGCLGATGSSGYAGRTNVKIGMYAWYGDRGDWLARKVRAVWNRGCYVSIIGAVMSDSVKHILLSPTGRGRIPTKLAITYKNGEPWQYYHDKFVAVSGVFGDQTDANLVWAGSTNFSDIGFLADDITIRQSSRANLLAYFRDFNHVYGAANVHAARVAPPRISNGRVLPPSKELPDPLGTGSLATLEAD